MAKKIVYVAPDSISALREIGVSALREIGVRVSGVETLVDIITGWKQQYGMPTNEEKDEGGEVIFPKGNYQPTKAWAVYKGRKGGKPLSWEISYQRFQQGMEGVSAIATNQPTGKPIQESTVVDHILTGLLHGRPVDLQRLASSVPALGPPRQQEWQQLDEAASISKINVQAPGEFAKSALVSPILARMNFDVTTNFSSKPDEQLQLEKRWYNHINWYKALLRAGWRPLFRSRAPLPQKTPSPSPLVSSSSSSSSSSFSSSSSLSSSVDDDLSSFCTPPAKRIKVEPHRTAEGEALQQLRKQQQQQQQPQKSQPQQQQQQQQQAAGSHKFLISSQQGRGLPGLPGPPSLKKEILPAQPTPPGRAGEQLSTPAKMAMQPSGQKGTSEYHTPGKGVLDSHSLLDCLSKNANNDGVPFAKLQEWAGQFEVQRDETNLSILNRLLDTLQEEFAIYKTKAGGFSRL
eukprot:g44922.t1